MTEIDLGLAGLPEMEPIPYILAIEREGWSVGVGMTDPKPRDIAKLYDTKRKVFALAYDITTDPVAYKIQTGTPEELADWLQENRPETLGRWLAGANIGADMLRTMREYASDPDAEAQWWKLCEDCDAGAIGLGVDLGDA